MNILFMVILNFMVSGLIFGMEKERKPSIEEKKEESPNGKKSGFLIVDKKYIKGTIDYNRMLIYAARNKDIEVAKLAILNSANVNCRDIDLKTPLHIAAANNNLKLVQLLLKNGADLNLRDIDRRNPFFLAVLNNSIQVIQFLARGYKKSISCSDIDANGPLHWIAIKNRYDILVELLLDHKFKTLDIKNNYGETPLFLAVKHNSIQVARALVKYKADVNCKDLELNTPLHLAVNNSNAELVKLLVDNKSDINSMNKKKDTPLLDAIVKKSLAITAVLFRAKCNVPDKDGEVRVK